MSGYDSQVLSIQYYFYSFIGNTRYYLKGIGDPIWEGINHTLHWFQNFVLVNTIFDTICNLLKMHDEFLWTPRVPSQDSNKVSKIFSFIQILLPFGNYIYLNPPYNLFCKELRLNNFISYGTIWALLNVLTFPGFLDNEGFIKIVTEPAFNNMLRWIQNNDHSNSIKVSLPYNRFSDIQGLMGLDKYREHLVIRLIETLPKMVNLYICIRLFSLVFVDIPTFVKSVRLYRSLRSLNKKETNLLRCLVYPQYLTLQGGFYFEELSLFKDSNIRDRNSLGSLNINKMEFVQSMARLQHAIVAMNNDELDVITVQTYEPCDLRGLPQFKILNRDPFNPYDSNRTLNRVLLGLNDHDLNSVLREVLKQISSLNMNRYKVIRYSRQFDIWYRYDNLTGLDFYEDKMKMSLRNNFKNFYEGYVRQEYLKNSLTKLYKGYLREANLFDPKSDLGSNEVITKQVINYLMDYDFNYFLQKKDIKMVLNTVTPIIKWYLFASLRNDSKWEEKNFLRYSYGLDYSRQFAYMVPYIPKIQNSNLFSIYGSNDESLESKLVYKYVSYVTIFKVLLGRFSDKYGFDELIKNLIRKDHNDTGFRYLMHNDNDALAESFRVIYPFKVPKTLSRMQEGLSIDSDQKFLLFVQRIAKIIATFSDKTGYPSDIMYDIIINNDWNRYADYFLYDWQLETLNSIMKDKHLNLFHDPLESGSLLNNRVSKNLMALIHLTIMNFDKGTFAILPLRKTYRDNYSLDGSLFLEQGMHKNLLFLDTSETMYVNVGFKQQNMNIFKGKITRYHNLQWYRPRNIDKFSLVKLLRLKFNLKECILGRNGNAVPEYLRREYGNLDPQARLGHYDHITNVFLVRPNELTFVGKIQMLGYLINESYFPDLDDTHDDSITSEDTEEKQPIPTYDHELRSIIVNPESNETGYLSSEMIENFLRSAGCFLALFTQPYRILNHTDNLTWDRLDEFMKGIGRVNMAPLVWALDTYSDPTTGSHDYIVIKSSGKDKECKIKDITDLMLTNPIMHSRFIGNDDMFLHRMTHATSLMRLSNYFMNCTLAGFDEHFKPYTNDKSGTATKCHSYYCKYYPEGVSKIMRTLDNEIDDSDRIDFDQYIDYGRNDRDNPISIDILKVQSSYTDRLKRIYWDYRIKMSESKRDDTGRNIDVKEEHEEREVLHFYRLYMVYTLYERLFEMIKGFMEYSLYNDLEISSRYNKMLELSLRYLRTRNDPKVFWDSKLQCNDLDKLRGYVNSYFPSDSDTRIDDSQQINDILGSLGKSLRELNEYISSNDKRVSDLDPNNKHESTVENHERYTNILPLMPPVPGNPRSGGKNKDDMQVLTHSNYLSCGRKDFDKEYRDSEEILLRKVRDMNIDHHIKVTNDPSQYWTILESE